VTCRHRTLLAASSRLIRNSGSKLEYNIDSQFGRTSTALSPLMSASQTGSSWARIVGASTLGEGGGGGEGLHGGLLPQVVYLCFTECSGQSLLGL
jgi:hypothetical protein